MQRNEIWWADLPHPYGARPVALISRNKAIQVRNSLTVAMVTTVVRDIPVEVSLGKTDGMPKSCVINCDVLLTIPKSILKSRITRLSHEKTFALNQALVFALGLN